MNMKLCSPGSRRSHCSIKVEQKFPQPIMASHGGTNKNGENETADGERRETRKGEKIKSRSSQVARDSSGRHTQAFDDRRLKDCSLYPNAALHYAEVIKRLRYCFGGNILPIQRPCTLPLSKC